ncbi:MAG: LacI family transcriptional regulator [Verrucomicrobia bacterium]|nr:MAG: LacI family transcriptional regulator [Verrucomicrobiota bacterium]
MKTKRNVLIALGWHDPRILEGVGRYAKEAGWHLEMRAVIESALPAYWRGDGMLANDTEVPRIKRFIENQIRLQPTVLIGSNHRYAGFPSVQEDNGEVGRLAAVHFLERGHQNFAWLGLPHGRSEMGRREAFVKTLQASGRSCHVLEWMGETSQRRDTWDNRREWLGVQLKSITKPLAVFVLDDVVAMDVIDVCLDFGLRVPEDVAVMGVGNMELACECARVPISSIDENLSEIAYRAAALLAEVMEGTCAGTDPGALREPLLVPVRGVFMRRSTDSLAVTHPGVQKALAFMTARVQETIGIGDIARAAGLSERALQYAFKNELRRTPVRQLLLLRLERAAHLLVSGESKVATVAEACGFGSVRHLHRCFVQKHGCSPQAYRNGEAGRESTAGRGA